MLKAYESGKKFKELTYLQTRVVLEYDKGLPENAEEAIRALFEKEQILVMKHSKNGEKEVDIKPAIQKLEVSPISTQELQLDCIASAQNPGLNPQLLVQAISRYLPDDIPDFSRISRVEIFDSQMEVFQ